jgi:signal recognition particle subunit SRP72
MSLVLRLDPKDADARQTKLFLLLQTEQYNAALSLIDSDDDHARHAYEKAYSLYRLSHESEARDVLKSIKADQNTEDSRGLVHLEAQLACRSLLRDAGQILMFIFVRLIAKDHMMLRLICTTSCSIPPNL